MHALLEIPPHKMKLSSHLHNTQLIVWFLLLRLLFSQKDLKPRFYNREADPPKTNQSCNKQTIITNTLLKKFWNCCQCSPCFWITQRAFGYCSAYLTRTLLPISNAAEMNFPRTSTPYGIQIRFCILQQPNQTSEMPCWHWFRSIHPACRSLQRFTKLAYASSKRGWSPSAWINLSDAKRLFLSLLVELRWNVVLLTLVSVQVKRILVLTPTTV